MESRQVFADLQLFTSYLKPTDLTFNQYLLLGPEPLLLHTGSRDQTLDLAPRLKTLLGGRQLPYVFVSHFEADECGGLAFLKEQFPEVRAVCSPVTARQLAGFGIAHDSIAQAPGDVLEAGDFRLRFVSYPSEMHLWEGLLAFEERRELLFSSDLFISRGELKETIVASTLEDQIRSIAPAQIPNPAAREAVAQGLRGLPIQYIVPGHGPCVKV